MYVKCLTQCLARAKTQHVLVIVVIVLLTIVVAVRFGYIRKHPKVSGSKQLFNLVHSSV